MNGHKGFSIILLDREPRILLQGSLLYQSS